MNKKVETNSVDMDQDSKKAAKLELSKDQKKALRREGMEERGRLTVPDEYKEEGFRYRICNVTPGNIENWKSKGYEVVTHDMRTGSGLTSQPELNGKPVEIEVGGASGSMKAIVMRCTEEDGQINDEIRDDLAREQANMIYQNPGIPESQLTGKITKENLR